MSGSKKVTVGYKYYLGMHIAICHSDIDALTRIKVDNRVAWEGKSSDGTITINEPGLFGGEDREGGISGDIDLEPGDSSQTQNTYLQARLGPDIPAFRGVFCVVLKQLYLGLNPYLKPWSFRVQRILKKSDSSEQWLKELARIPTDLEPPLDEISLVWQLYDRSPDFPDYVDFDRSSSNTKTVNFNPGDGQLHTIRIVVDSLAELRTYTGSTPVSGTSRVVIGGTPGNLPTWNVYKLEISNPPIIYHLNHGTSNLTLVENQDAFDIEVQDGATITLSCDTNGEGMVGPYQYMSVLVDTTFDMNPAHIIRECLTDKVWGMGYLSSDIDDDSFTLAAATLFDEKMGISLLWDRQIPIEDFISEIVRHINATLYVNPLTGKFTLKLIRNDYDVDSLLILNESNISKVSDYSRVNLGDAINSVTVVYWNTTTEENASITVDNIGLIQQTGSVVNTTIQYPGFTNAVIASLVAARDLKTFSTPLLSVTLETNREASELNIGDTFKFEWPDYHDGYVVMRVHQIAFGNGKQNRIKITASEDIFALPNTVIVRADGNSWTEPVDKPIAATYRSFEETPYYELVRVQGQSAVDLALSNDPTIGYISGAVGRAGNCINARLWIDSGAGYSEADVMDFMPYGELSADLSRLGTSATLVNYEDLEEIRIGSFARIENEYIRIDTVDTGTGAITFGRGVLDTLPEPHSSSTAVLFLQDYAESDEVEYADSESINGKMLTTAGLGTLGLSDAPVDNVVMDSRAARPYPPGDLRVNSNYFPDYIDGLSTLSLSWAHRDKTQQTGADFLDFTDGDVGPEAGTTYTLRIYGEQDTLGRTETGIATNSYVYSLTDERADFEIPADDSFSPTATRDTLGATIPGSADWAGMVDGGNGKIYGIPWDATTILIVDTATGTATTSAMGATLTGSAKWSGGVLAGDGKIYCVPWDATDVLIIDPVGGTATRSTMGSGSLTGTGKWNGGVLGGDGKVYGMPRDSNDILIINVAGGSYSRSTMGAGLSGGDKWAGGVLGGDGKIYGIPSTATNILIINVGAGTASTSNMGASLSGPAKYWGGCLASNGKIYGIPRFASNILIINVGAGTASTNTMGADFTGTTEWAGGVESPDGIIYCFPWATPDILQIDVGTETATRSSLGVGTLPAAGDWWSGCLASDGKIYGSPFSAGDILIMTVSNTSDYRINGSLRFELESVRAGLASIQKYNWTVLREGYGFNYGKYYGGNS